ncbi:MAG: Smr/MutS family protein [Crocinitomicaceae bacterium]|nr:Smr/MutS family protein [Crocinitomicaceae bacterium]
MNPGDKVSVIADTIKGIVKTIDGNNVLIEDEFGFERSYQKSELVLVKGDYNFSEIELAKEIKDKIKAQLREDGHVLKSFEIDLHIEELIDDHRNMTNHEILIKQMNICRGFVQKAIANNTKRIVLIHGKGEGVLKAEIHQFLNNLRNLNGVALEYHDAPYVEYGMGGATEVIFH